MSAYTCGSAEYRPITQGDGFKTPIPRRKRVGEWLHIPYGSRNLWETDSGQLHMTWSVTVELPSMDDYDTLAGYHDAGSFQTTTTPFGTFSAQVESLQDAREHEDGTVEAPVVFSWA